jgi:regulator of sigma E protease
MSYLYAALLLGLAVLVHEWGHFAAARLVGMPVRTFSVGFGPKLWGKKYGATEYRLSLVPFGGYVLPDVKDEREYFALPVGVRIVMTSGGVLANAALAFAAISLANCLKLGLSWQAAIVNPWTQASTLTVKIIAIIPQLFSRPDDISGVVGIVAQGGRLIGNDPWNGLIFLAIMSINLLIINLLPLPALDGGKLLLFLLETVHPAFLRLHLPLAVAGWVLIAVLTGYTLYIDVGRYIIPV